MLAPEISLYDALWLQNITMLSALALLLYDHALCFDDEIDHIWSARQNVVTISFLLARYITPIFLILGILSVVSTIDSLHPLPSMVPYLLWTNGSCHALNLLRLTTATVIVSNLLVHIIMALRVYALFGAKRIVIFCLLVLLAIEVFIMVITTVLLEKEPEGSVGDQNPCKSTAASPRSTALFWACPLIGDTIIFALTLMKTRQYSTALGPIPILRLLSRDGTLYYAAIFVIHIFNLFLISLGPPQLRAFGVSFTQALATLLVCRIVLNLCKQRGDPPNDSSSVLDTSATRRKNSTVFTSVMPDAVAFFGPSTPSSSQFREHNLELDNIRT